jgi:competence protein ComEA
MALLYRLQHTVALTTTELRALAVLVLLFAGGHLVRTWQDHQTPPVSPRLLIQEARALQARSATPAPALAPRVDSVRAVAQEDAARFAAELAAARALEARRDGGAARSGRTSKKAAAPIPRLNVNTATGAQLELLPRIGPALAARIVAYREAHGGFRRPAELTNVKGIGDKTLEKLLPYVFVE